MIDQNMHFFCGTNNIPPPSTPRATGHNPEATTAADPLEEPPEILLGSCGFLVALEYDSYNVSMLAIIVIEKVIDQRKW